MRRSKHIGILGMAVVGLLTLGACGSSATTSPATKSAQHVSRNDVIECGHVPFARC
jgi:hypothetical protein